MVEVGVEAFVGSDVTEVVGEEIAGVWVAAVFGVSAVGVKVVFTGRVEIAEVGASVAFTGRGLIIIGVAVVVVITFATVDGGIANRTILGQNAFQMRKFTGQFKI